MQILNLGMDYFLFLIPTKTTAGIPMYIPRFSIITDSSSDMTSDSAFSISDSVKINGVFFNNVKFRD